MNSIPAGIYQALHNIDLNKPINFTDDFFDAVLCVGTFTFGHVKAKALSEFTRIVKSGGIIGFTINEGVFLDYGFKSELDHLVIQKKITQLDFYLSDYLSSKGVKAWLGIYRVN
jgi:ubiquinone/menaquinone biosynthesis C-methylase UbiE